MRDHCSSFSFSSFIFIHCRETNGELNMGCYHALAIDGNAIVLVRCRLAKGILYSIHCSQNLTMRPKDSQQKFHFIWRITDVKV